MKIIIAVSCVLILLTSCTSKPQNKILTYQNIVILADMSSRIDNKQPKDLDEINKIIQFYKNECVKPGEKIGDRSCITFSAFSEKVSASIDLDKIKSVGAKQSFINSTGEYKNNGLDKQIEIFEQKVKNKYANVRNPGLDLISGLIEKIENEPIIKQNTYLINGIDTTFINFENHIYVFTDGYLEYLNKSANSQFYFSNTEINKVRQYCIDNNLDISKAIKTNSSLGLPIIESNKNGNINLHILETHERDKNEEQQTYKYPKGQRDNEILEAIWRKWTIESGFESFEWKKY